MTELSIHDGVVLKNVQILIRVELTYCEVQIVIYRERHQFGKAGIENITTSTNCVNLINICKSISAVANNSSVSSITRIPCAPLNSFACNK